MIENNFIDTDYGYSGKFPLVYNLLTNLGQDWAFIFPEYKTFDELLESYIVHLDLNECEKFISEIDELLFLDKEELNKWIPDGAPIEKKISENLKDWYNLLRDRIKKRTEELKILNKKSL